MSDQDKQIVTAEDAKRQFEQTMNGAALNRLNVQSDKEGNSYILGFKVSKSIAPVLETAVPNFVNWMQSVGSKFSYDQALKFATDSKIKFVSSRANAIAKAAEYGIRWGFIGLEPATDALMMVKSYNRERKALFNELQPVIQATKANYKTNEVIHHAFEQLHDSLITDAKRLGANLITIVPMAYTGYKEQTERNIQRKLPLPVADGLEQSMQAEMAAVQKQVDEHSAYASRQVAIQTQMAQAKPAALKEFIAKNREKIPGENGGFLDEAGMKRLFESSWSEAMRNLQWHEKNKGRNGHGDNEEAANKKKDNKQLGTGVIFGLSVVRQVVKGSIDEASAKRKEATSAWEMIRQLRSAVESQCGNPTASDGKEFSCKSADELFIDTPTGGSLPLKQYIFEVFQQNERDHGRAVIGPALRAQLMPAVDYIADAIADGRLDSLALVNLVGDGKIIEHKGKGLRKFAAADKVDELIEAQVAILNTREHIKPEEFFANFADPGLIQGTLKKNLAEMKGLEKAFFAALFPDDILLQAGVKSSEIAPLRKQVHDHMYAIVAAGMLKLNALPPEQLKEFGLTEKQMEYVHSLVEKINTGDEQAIKTAVDGRDKTALDLLRVAGLNAQTKNLAEGAGFWASRVKESTETLQKLAEAKTESAVDRETNRKGKESSEAVAPGGPA